MQNSWQSVLILWNRILIVLKCFSSGWFLKKPGRRHHGLRPYMAVPSTSCLVYPWSNPARHVFIDKKTETQRKKATCCHIARTQSLNPGLCDLEILSPTLGCQWGAAKCWWSNSSVSRPFGSAVCKAQSPHSAHRGSMCAPYLESSLFDLPLSYYLQVSSVKPWTFRPQHIVGVQNSEKKRKRQ